MLELYDWPSALKTAKSNTLPSSDLAVSGLTMVTLYFALSSPSPSLALSTPIDSTKAFSSISCIPQQPDKNKIQRNIISIFSLFKILPLPFF